jgi:hypothetical protein
MRVLQERLPGIFGGRLQRLLRSARRRVRDRLPGGSHRINTDPAGPAHLRVPLLPAGLSALTAGPAFRYNAFMTHGRPGIRMHMAADLAEIEERIVTQETWEELP